MKEAAQISPLPPLFALSSWQNQRGNMENVQYGSRIFNICQTTESGTMQDHPTEQERKRLSRLFAEHTVADGECLIWQRSKDRHGYGQIGLRGKTKIAHRLSYWINIGPIPEGMHVLHSCDRRDCVNPEHLRTGTNADNVVDKLSRGRQFRGMDSPVSNQIITDADILEIRRLRERGLLYREIGEIFQYSRENVSCICRRKTWRHVP